jgi:hypothetical protein
MSLHRNMRIGLAVSTLVRRWLHWLLQFVKSAKSFPASLLIFVTTIGVDDDAPLELGSRYESGRSSLWLKTINPSAPALLRLEQEDWRG